MSQKLFLGTKLFRYNDDDSFDIIRVIRLNGPNKVKIKNETTGEELKVEIEALSQQGYQILEAIGIMSFSIVTVGKNKDVVITLTRMMDVKLGTGVPCVICRQSVTDFFYNLLSQTEEHGYVGVSVSDKTCPTNIEYGAMLACDEIEYSDVVYTYYDDTIDSVLECVKCNKFNDVLNMLYETHIKSINKPKYAFKKMDKGWCRNIKDLMLTNNFWIDVDSAYNITDVDFDISEHLIEKIDENDQKYNSFDENVREFLCKTFELNIVDTIVTEYFYDIDLVEYNNSNYVLIRGKDGKLYFVVYLIQGTYFESDIAKKKEKENLSYKLGLYIYNKYEQSNK